VRRRLLLAAALAATLLASHHAHAQVIAEPAPPKFPDPKKFAKGFFAQGELGALVYLGRTGENVGAGTHFGVRLGYDIFRWLAVQLHVAGASSEATLPPPTTGQSIQTYLYLAEARGKVQIRRVALFAQAGAGFSQLSSNILDQVGITTGSLFSFAVIAGGGIDYHTLNRHFSFGLNVDYIWMQTFDSTHALTATAYLRYTH
jgi:hypothetical protein